MSRIPSAPANADTDKAATGGLISDLRGSSGGDATPAEMIVVAPRRKRPSTQTLVLILVLAASAASLYTMRKQGMASGIVFTPVKLDYEPEKNKPDDLKAQQRIMAELARSVSPDSFHDEPLRKNPFRMDSTTTVAAAPAPTVDSEAAERAAREADIRTRYGSLTLNGVMMGPTPLARISGKTYTVSDTVDEVFVVREIRDRAVDLIADGKNYTLQMSDTSAPGGNGGGRRPGGPPTPPRR